MGKLRSSAASGLCFFESDRGLLRAPWGFAGKTHIYRAVDTPASQLTKHFAQFAASRVHGCGVGYAVLRRTATVDTAGAVRAARHRNGMARTGPFAFAMKKADERELCPYVDSPEGQ
jgi:hypothetical protein